MLGWAQRIHVPLAHGSYAVVLFVVSPQGSGICCRQRSDSSTSLSSLRTSSSLRLYSGRCVQPRLRVLDHEKKPVYGAELRIAGVGRSRTNKQGYTKFYLPHDDWYALTIKYDNHEEVLYQEKMTPGRTYVYRPDPLSVSGRLCALSPE